jgi:dephospho-CoA kinase
VVPFIGLTGGIGAGKSTALEALERLGAAVLSTDLVVHELYSTDEVREAVVERFGSEVAPGGVVDRGAVAGRAFGSPEERAWLEGMLWPRVGARMAEWREGLSGAEPAPRAAVVEVPLLFESGMEAAFDATIAIVVDEQVRSERAASRGHEAVDERAARQLSQDDKAARATFVVLNDGSVAELESKLSAVLDKLER